MYEIGPMPNLIKGHRHKLSLPSQISESVSPFTVAPADQLLMTKSCHEQPADYFASIHATTYDQDEEDHSSDIGASLKGGREDAGPSVNEGPVLQKIFAKMGADNEDSHNEDSHDDDSSDSELERCRKRKSILYRRDEIDPRIVERFRPRHDDEETDKE